MSDKPSVEPASAVSPPDGDSIPSADASAIWRSAVADTVAYFDKHFTHPMRNSRRLAEREIGKRMDDHMQHLFRLSRNLAPTTYEEALRDGKILIASAIEARRAETAQTGSVHESAVPQADAKGVKP